MGIDHHATNTRFADVNWIVDTAGSTAEMVYYLLRALAWKIDEATASLRFGAQDSLKSLGTAPVLSFWGRSRVVGTAVITVLKTVATIRNTNDDCVGHFLT